MNRLRRAAVQLRHMKRELTLLVGKKTYRWLLLFITIWFGSGAGVVLSYRLDRFLFLLLGSAYSLLRVLIFPWYFLLRVWAGRTEIHYEADIGGGLRILHPSLGIVISKYAVCGDNLTLTGGNCIGGRKALRNGDLVLGNNVALGANAVVLGPVKLGNDVSVGAGAVAVKDAPDGVILVGVPAQPLERSC